MTATARQLARLSLALICAISAPGIARGQEPKSDQTAESARYVQTVAGSLLVESDEKSDDLKLKAAPLLKYSDPARGYSAAGVWRLGETGRPMALLSVEHWLRAETDEPRLMFELMSLTEKSYRVKSASVTLPADGSAPKFASLEGQEKPAAGHKQRLIQFRNLARRYAVEEKNMGEFFSLRLLTQPIDRYDDAAHGITDGAVFVFVYGTNPELALLLECDKDQWRYALARMSWAELGIEFDGKEVARFEQLTGFPDRGAYRSAGHVIRNTQP
jgi:hypothetical protein